MKKEKTPKKHPLFRLLMLRKLSTSPFHSVPTPFNSPSLSSETKEEADLMQMILNVRDTLLLELNSLALLLPSSSLSTPASAIVRERAHVRAGACVGPAVRARTAHRPAAHGAAA